jgi:hypothetical protein
MSAKGRRLLFIDTCHSAGAYNERLGNPQFFEGRDAEVYTLAMLH